MNTNKFQRKFQMALASFRASFKVHELKDDCWCLLKLGYLDPRLIGSLVFASSPIHPKKIEQLVNGNNLTT